MLRKICALVLAMALLASAFACTSVQEDSSSETNNTDTSASSDLQSSGTDASENEDDTESTEEASGGVLRIVTAGKGSGIGFPAGFTGYYERIYSYPALESLARI